MGRQRQPEGDETWLALLGWLKGQKAAERLAGAILQSEGFTAVDPSHPLGGKDGLKDILCQKDGLRFIGAAYFPRGQKSFRDIKTKFSGDLKGVAKHNADGFVFVTNQELRLRERKALEKVNPAVAVELYHLERLTQVLNVPKNYGTRMEFLGIHITEEEHLAFFAARDEEHYRRLEELNTRLDTVLARIEEQTKDLVGYATGGEGVAYLRPIVRRGGAEIEFVLESESKYPVFDVRGLFYEYKSGPVNKAQGEKQYVERTIDLGTMYPHSSLWFNRKIDMKKKDKIKIRVVLVTRTKFVTEQIRLFKVKGEIVIAYQVRSFQGLEKMVVPETVPGYDPEDPEAVFRDDEDSDGEHEKTARRQT